MFNIFLIVLESAAAQIQHPICQTTANQINIEKLKYKYLKIALKYSTHLHSITASLPLSILYIQQLLYIFLFLRFLTFFPSRFFFLLLFFIFIYFLFYLISDTSVNSRFAVSKL